MTKKQHYMTTDERQQLEALYTAKIPVARIAKQLGFCRQTIYNEIRIGFYEYEKDGFLKPRYSAVKAQQKHDYAQTAKGRPLKIGRDRAYADYLEAKIVKARYSPAAALASARRAGYQTRICTATLYSYIEKGVFLDLTTKHLWEKSKKKKGTMKRYSASRIRCCRVSPTVPNTSTSAENAGIGKWTWWLAMLRPGLCC